MSKATKRERQRQNREAARLARMAAEKRRRRLKTLRNVAVVAVVVAGVIFAINTFTGGGGNKKKAAPKPPAGSPPLSIDPKAKYTATIETSEGEIVAELDAKQALWGTNNFVTLARKGFYDGLSFHRAAKDFVIQGGDPKGDGSGGPGYTFVAEIPKAKYKIGDLAYAKTGTDPAGSAGSQFFVITGKNGPALPKDYAVFGNVTKGLDIAQKIETYAPASGDGKPTKDVKIVKVTIEGPPPVTTTVKATTTITSSSSAPIPSSVPASSTTGTAPPTTTAKAPTTTAATTTTKKP